MTTDKMRLWYQGRDFWYQYLKLNDFSVEPTEKGLKVLSKNLDVNVPWLRKCIHLFLSE